jgi:hypothetical protein
VWLSASVEPFVSPRWPNPSSERKARGWHSLSPPEFRFSGGAKLTASRISTRNSAAIHHSGKELTCILERMLREMRESHHSPDDFRDDDIEGHELADLG